MSAQTKRSKEYYLTLERNQRGGLDITRWLEWYLGCLGRAVEGAEVQLAGILKKARVWDRINKTPVNDRQRAVINRLLDGFEGKLTSSKYSKLSKCSHDTALRDIKELIGAGILVQGEGGGRSTGYEISAAAGKPAPEK
jgi:Fic family protein